MMAIEKGPAAELLISLYLIYIVIKRNSYFPVKLVIYMGLFLLILLSIFYIFFMGSESIIQAISAVFSRLLTGQIQPAYHYLEYFREHDFLMETTFPNPRGIFPFESFHLNVEIMNWVHPELAEKRVVGSMPTIYWGEMYANFGIFGILIPPFFVGFGLYWVNVIIFKLRHSPIVVALFVYMATLFKDLAATPMTSFILNIYMILIIAIFIALLIYSNNGKIYIKKNNDTALKH